MRGWASNQKISGRTVDLLIKEGFDCMEALILIDSDDLSQNQNSTRTADATTERSAVAYIIRRRHGLCSGGRRRQHASNGHSGRS